MNRPPSHGARAPAPFWADMTTLDFAGDTSGWVAVVPTAAIEQHGPHLPLGTDTMIAQGMVAETVARLPADLPVTFLPVQTVGKSNEHVSFAGTLTLGWDTAIRAWVELGASVARAGLRKIVFVNSHGGNTALLDVVTRELRVRFDMLAVHTAWMRFGDGDTTTEEERAIGIHGGTVETALIRHFRPETVRDAHVAHFGSRQQELAESFTHLRGHGPHAFAWEAGDLNPMGVMGDATAATPEMGATIAAHQAEGFVALLRDVAAVPMSLLR